MKASVVGKHQWRQVKFPIQSWRINNWSEVFLNRFVENFHLSITLRMIGWIFCVFDFQFFTEFFWQFVDKFFSSVSVNLRWNSVSANPFVEKLSCNSWCFFVLNCHNLCIFGKSVSHTKNVVVFVGRWFNGSKQIQMNSLIWSWTGRQRL